MAPQPLTAADGQKKASVKARVGSHPKVTRLLLPIVGFALGLLMPSPLNFSPPTPAGLESNADGAAKSSGWRAGRGFDGGGDDAVVGVNDAVEDDDAVVEDDDAMVEDNDAVVEDNDAVGGAADTPSYAWLGDVLSPNRLSELPSHLPFDVTPAMFRASRPVVGNPSRLRAYLRKLRRGECTNVLTLGGSVTGGHNAKGPPYPARFVEWLNDKYPCSAGADGGAGGRHAHLTTVAENSQTNLVLWDEVMRFERVDLVLVEFNVNDAFISGVPHALEEKGDLADTPEYKSLFYGEILYRRLLLLRAPGPAAVVTFSADYIGRMWGDRENTGRATFNPETARQMLFYRNGEPGKAWLSSMYEVPTVSVVSWLLPLAGKLGRMAQFDREYAYSTINWHADTCCHPKERGHFLLGLVLAYNIVEEERLMLNEEFEDGGGVSTGVGAEHDFTADEMPLLRDPMYLSPAEDALYVTKKLNRTVAHDFQTNDAATGVVANEGWKWRADNAYGDKFGYIAEGAAGGQHLAFNVTGGPHGRIEVAFVCSYESMGKALAWTDDSAVNGRAEECGKKINGERAGRRKRRKRGKKGDRRGSGSSGGDGDGRRNLRDNIVSNVRHSSGGYVLNGFWDKNASVPRIEIFTDALKEDEKKFFHVCLTPKGANHQGDTYMFKLLGLSLY